VPGNIGSEKVIEKSGFEKEGVLRDHSYAREKYFDMSMYSLINKNSDR
jgi:RimJ/RimL family protein N-acetyltransferase